MSCTDKWVQRVPAHFVWSNSATHGGDKREQEVEDVTRIITIYTIASTSDNQRGYLFN